MEKKLSKEEQEFIRKVAQDSYNININLPELKKAYQLLTGNELGNIRQIRQKMFEVHTNPSLLGEQQKNELEMPQFLKDRIEKEKANPPVSKATAFADKVEQEMKEELPKETTPKKKGRRPKKIK